MTYWVLFTSDTEDDLESLLDSINRPLNDRLENDPGFEMDFANADLESPEKWLKKINKHLKSVPAATQKSLSARLKKAQSALIFEGPAEPADSPQQVTILRKYLANINDGVMVWAENENEWPAIQAAEDALKVISKMKSDPSLLGSNPTIDEDEASSDEEQSPMAPLFELFETMEENAELRIEFQRLLPKLSKSEQELVRILLLEGANGERGIDKRLKLAPSAIEQLAKNLTSKIRDLM